MLPSLLRPLLLGQVEGYLDFEHRYPLLLLLLQVLIHREPKVVHPINGAPPPPALKSEPPKENGSTDAPGANGL